MAQQVPTSKWRITSQNKAVHGCSIHRIPHTWGAAGRVTRRILDAMFLKLGPSRLTHDVLTTLMAEVTAIVNSRPLTYVSSDPEQPLILTPAMLLTQKVGAHTVPPEQFDDSDIYRCQWQQVQHLANEFWKMWRNKYVCCLQNRRKWRDEKKRICGIEMLSY